MFYVENDNKILLFDEDKQKLQDTIAFMPQYEGLEIKEVEEGYVIYDFELMTVEEKKAKEAQKERQRIDSLILTPSDVERALYYSPLQMDFDDLKALIAEKVPQIDLKGLAIEFRANNFYRGAVDKDGNRIIDMVGAILGYTPEDMDYLFEHKQLPVHEEEPVEEPTVEETVEEPVEEPVEETVEEPTVNEEETAKEPVEEPVVEPKAEPVAEETAEE